MNFSVVGATDNQAALVERALAAFGYPIDVMGTDVTIAFVVEPSYPGTEEFAAATQTGPGEWLIEVRSNLDQLGRDPEGIYEGPEFFMETVIHEMGHVIAGTWLGTPEKRASMAVCFERKNREPGYPADGNITYWQAGDWTDRIEEAVAESIKDVWLPLSIRAYDNRTKWILKQSSFGAFVALLDPYAGSGGSMAAKLVHPTRNTPVGVPIVDANSAHALTLSGEEPNTEGFWWGYGSYVSASILFGAVLWEEVRDVFGTVRVTFDYEIYHDPSTYPEPVRGLPFGWDLMSVVNQYVDGLTGYEWGFGVVLEATGGSGSFRRKPALWWGVAETAVAPAFDQEITLPPVADYQEEMTFFGMPLIGLYAYVKARSDSMTRSVGDGDSLTTGSVLPSGGNNEYQKSTVTDWTVSWSAPPLELKGVWPYNDVTAASPGPVLRVRRSLP